MKVTVIGGGSTYTPELIDGFIRSAEKLDLTEVVLLDTDPERLKVVGEFSQRMTAHARAPFTVALSQDRPSALKGSDFVLTQIRVGGQKGRHKDIKLGHAHGLIGQETTGVGGFAKALRTIPVMQEITKDIKDYCPDAWVVNFTNPSGLITESLHWMGLSRVVGLCNIPIGAVMDLALYLQCDPDRITIDYVGLNHLSWIRKVFLDGEDVTERIISDLAEQKGPANIPELEYDPAFVRALGFIPSPYLRYFYATSDMLGKQWAKPKSRAQEVMEIENELLAMYKDESVVTKPEALSKRGGAFYSKIAIDLVTSLMGLNDQTHIVNVLAGDCVDGIGAGQVVEISAHISKDKIVPLKVEPPEPKILGLMQAVKAYETLAVEAGILRSYDAALMALSIHPLCGPEKAKLVLDDLLKINKLEFR